MVDTTKKLLLLFDRGEKKKLLILFFMMIIAALFETFGIGVIVPFVGIVTNPSIIKEHSSINFLYKLFNFQSTTSFLIFSVCILLIIFILKNLYIILFQNAQNRVILNQQVKLSRRLFREYLSKPYIFHIQRNSSDLLRNVNIEVQNLFQGIIMSAFLLLTELLVIACILGLLLYTNTLSTLVASILLGGSVYLFFKVFRKKVNELAKEQQAVSGTMIKWVNQGLGASKEVKVSGKESFFVNAYTSKSQINANIKRYKIMLEQSPRLFIETILVIIVLVMVLIIILQGKNTSNIVSTMALFAMAAFRLMPSINRVMAAITSIRFSKPSLSVIYEDLFTNNNIYPTQINCDSKLNINENKAFTDSIELMNVSFRYPNQQEYSLKDISLSIQIGHSVAFIGESGAGKTTLVDMILGLFEPEKGSILVDGKNIVELKSVWQKKIGYIPQTIFLTDDSIRENVAFGILKDQIDDHAVWKALEQAQLKGFVKSLPSGLNTPVGEHGIRLSGGQRQRIGIARALYHNPEIIFMDEATSALDTDTEKDIMTAIDGLKGEKTLIIIAHRLSTIKNCDTVFKMSNGRLVSMENKLGMSVI
ncbi:ABC transporter ATP-binding protein [Gottfriedia acidiceleris]|uniref:ABC transporter ATP-binding protein n=1 Tax=Gottfriedia acidiceleris TaxID=371036 RepID=UPI000B42D9DB|nr:ABC transporter ATP-binding protein [Gottfriedia acidiceleris]